MLNYREWAERAFGFAKRLESLPGDIRVTAVLRPPMDPSEVQALSNRLRIPLPAPLRAFLTHASSGCHCEYRWTPPADLQGRLQELFPHQTFVFGGATLCHSDWLEGCGGWFEECDAGCFDTAVAFASTRPEEARVWANSVAFHAVGNGDYFALYAGRDRPSDEFPVVHLDHDGCGTLRLAGSFDEFLAGWEQLNYIDGLKLRDYFVDPIRGAINPASPKKPALDDLFRTAQNVGS